MWQLQLIFSTSSSVLLSAVTFRLLAGRWNMEAIFRQRLPLAKTVLYWNVLDPWPVVHWYWLMEKVRIYSWLLCLAHFLSHFISSVCVHLLRFNFEISQVYHNHLPKDNWNTSQHYYFFDYFDLFDNGNGTIIPVSKCWDIILHSQHFSFFHFYRVSEIQANFNAYWRCWEDKKLNKGDFIYLIANQAPAAWRIGSWKWAYNFPYFDKSHKPVSRW